MKKITTLFIVLIGIATSPLLAQTSANTSQQFQQQLAAVFKANVKLKDAFVSADGANISTAASAVKLALQNANASLLKDDLKKEWVGNQKNLLANINQISSTNSIADQRKAFAAFSTTL